MKLQLSFFLSGLLVLVSAQDAHLDEPDSHASGGGLRALNGQRSLKGNDNGSENGNNRNNGNNNGNNGNGNGGNKPVKPPAHGRNKIKARNCNNNSKAPHCDAELKFNLGSDEELDFTLPNGKVITFKKTPGNGKGRNWSGESPSGGRANIIDRFDRGAKEDRFFGSFVDTEDGEYTICQLRPDFTGRHVINCEPGADFKDEIDPHVTPNGRLLMETEDVLRLAHENRNLQSTPSIDMMVLWTPKAECSVSGLGAGCPLTSTTESNMRGLIDLAVAETNTAFTNSGINAQVRLLHAYKASYTERPSWSDTLNDLRNGIGNSNSLRSQYGADAVAMIIDQPGYCGMAYLGPSPDWMYSITQYSCATGYYTFGHELGHNLGCEHDRGTVGACSSSASNFGYRDPSANFRTIMAYACVSGQCDGNPGGNCPKVQMFSNNYGLTTPSGAIAGNAYANNADQINSVAATVAGYYTAPQPPTPPPTPAPTPGPTPSPVSPPTPAPVSPPTPAPVPTGSSCTDVEGWYDSDGPYYDCDWYASYAPASCTNYGDYYANFGRTANSACCACNGGQTAKCIDTPGWYDSDGSYYNCDWYGSNPNYCSYYGNWFENFGQTANQACCTCGGGF